MVEDYSLNSNEYIVGMKKGLSRAIEIIEEEKKFAIEINPQVAMGMAQILMLLDKELKNS